MQDIKARLSRRTLYYVFFSAIEIPCLLFIVWTAWRWAEPSAAVASACSATSAA